MMKYCLVVVFALLSACSSGGGGSPSTTPPPGQMPPPQMPPPAQMPVSGLLPGDKYVLGTGSFAKESSRIADGVRSPLRIIDEGLFTINGVMQGHSINVLDTARINGFGILDSTHIRLTNDYIGTPISDEGLIFRTIIGEYDSALSPNYVVNVSYSPLFNSPIIDNPELIPVSLLEEKKAAFVIATGNSRGNNSHGETGGLAAARAGYVLFVTGLDLGEIEKGNHVLARDASPCLWAKEFCVAASFMVDVPVAGRIEGTSFATPLVSSLLANARLLWPSMTSVQTLNLARFCARPVQADGSLGAWGTILTNEQADDNFGQGVFSVECLYAENGALFNPITEQSIVGSLGVRGTSTAVLLADTFGREYPLSQNRGGITLPLLAKPKEDEIFFGQNNILGVAWSGMNLGVRVDENQFFGSQGTGDFRMGDSYVVFLQLSHRFDIDDFYLDIYGLSVWADMYPAARSVVTDAQGFSHQISARAGYQDQGLGLDAMVEVLHNFGVDGKLTLAGYGNIDLVPAANTQVRLHFTQHF